MRRSQLPLLAASCLLVSPLACVDPSGVALIPNAGPLIQILQPVIGPDGEEFLVEAGDGVLFVAVVDDAEDAPEELPVSWSAQRTDLVADPVVLGESETGSDGYSEFLVAGLEAGGWRINAQVVDSAGAADDAGLPIRVLESDATPEVVISQPLDGSEFLEGTLITFSGLVTDDRGLDALTVEWLSDLDGVLDVAPPSSGGLLIFSTDELHAGSHVVTVSVRDESNNIGQASVAIEVITDNLPPTAPVVDVTPDGALTDDELSCIVVVGSSDPEGASVAYEYLWLLDGNPTGAVTSDLPASDTARGDTWTCEVRASDGLQLGPAGADSVTIGNSSPSATSAELTPDPAFETSVVTCAAIGFSDADGDPAVLLHAWTVDGIPAAATGPTLDGASFDRDQVVQCTLTPTDGIDSGPALMSSPLTISNSPPTAPGLALDPTPQAELIDDLTCQMTVASTDADGDTPTYEIRWVIDGIVDATYDGDWVIPAGEAALGEEWVCESRAHDGTDYSPWAASAVTQLAPLSGDLVISEFLSAPLAVTDVAGEWVELFNARDHELDLLGFELLDDSGDSYVINESVVVPAGGRVLLGRNGDLASNGGVTVDHEYSGFALEDDVDEIVLSFDGDEIDRVEYDNTWIDGLAGSAWALDPDIGDPDATANDAASAWCRSAVPQAGLGSDLGTPGLVNDGCPCGASDDDLDGFGDLFSCGFLDCDDGDASINPAAFDVCEDGIDQDCVAGDALCDCLITDDDGDGYGDGAACAPLDCDDADPAINPGMTEACNAIDDDCDGVIDDGFDVDGDGFTTCAGDCADLDASRNPAAIEVCDGVDDDCDGVIDDGFDVDGDGFTTCAGDCDDTNPSVHSGASEACDAVDSNCDGSLVDGFANFDGDALPDCIDPDDDNDGDNDTSDCNDNDAAIYTGAPEACDGVDSDCDGSLVDGFPNYDGDTQPDCIDLDDDNDGDLDASDCNDNNAAIYNGAPEACDSIDSDCDGSLVDTFSDWDGDGTPDCVDADNDNDGDPNTSDCNDTNASIYTGAPEACDSIDSDCDGSLVDGFSNYDGDSQPDCIDPDDDNDGDLDTSDCNDNNASIYNGAPESCDSVDSDCDGSLIDGFSNFDGDAQPDCVDVDDDNDGDPDTSDCNDANAAIYTGAPESCDSIDSDCDGSLVDSFSNYDGDSQPDCIDVDDDNDGDPDSSDCNDNNASIYTGAPESCDWTDSDCDGSLVDGFSNYDGDSQPDCIDVDDDNDGDPDSSDCNDNNASIYTGAPESCDWTDSDCDGSLVDGYSNFDGDYMPNCIDSDDDNDGDPDTSDCNDSNASIYTGAPEACNGVDDDCDGTVDDDVPGDAWEPNDSLSAATWIAGDDSDVTIYPTFEYSTDDYDWFSISTSDDTNFGCDDFHVEVWAQSIPAGADYDIRLYGPSLSLLDWSENYGNVNEHFDWNAGCSSWGNDGGTYYIRVHRWSGYSCSDSYLLRVANSD